MTSIQEQVNQLHQTLDRLVLLDLPAGADPLLTDRQLAALMGCSIQTLRRKRARGEFPAFVQISPKRHGTRLSEYKAFLQSQK